jgi:hypothetical protein
VEVGIACSYYALTVQGYGNAGTVGFDIGAIAALGRSIRLGAVAANINAPVIGTCREKLPQMLSLAAAIDILPRFSFSAELVRDARFPLSLRCGVEYRPLNSFSLSFGAAGDPAIVGGGFSVAFSKIRLEYAAQYHQQLGVSHFVSLLFTFSDFLRGDQHIGLLN